jgi:membrane protein DedA with SNARE-associated domain
MEKAYLLVESYGAAVVFVFVFLRQAGLPLPGIAGLLFFGSQVGAGRLRPVDALLAGVAGCVAADVLWFRLGRAMGPRVLTLLSKFSLQAEPNVDATKERFHRLGLKSLLIAKFIPWFDMIAPPVAGMLGAPYALFVPWTACGGLIWLLVYGGLGVAFSDRIADVIAATERWVGPVGWTAAVVFAGFIAWKYVKRRRAPRRFSVVRDAVQSSPSVPLSRGGTPRTSGKPEEVRT